MYFGSNLFCPFFEITSHNTHDLQKPSSNIKQCHMHSSNSGDRVVFCSFSLPSVANITGCHFEHCSVTSGDLLNGTGCGLFLTLDDSGVDFVVATSTYITCRASHRSYLLISTTWLIASIAHETPPFYYNETTIGDLGDLGLRRCCVHHRISDQIDRKRWHWM